MGRLLIALSTCTALLLGMASSAPAQPSDPETYCIPENSQADPQDLMRPNAPPIEIPPGFTMRRISVGGFSTIAIESGPRDSQEAVVFLHGNPGNSLDYLGPL